MLWPVGSRRVVTDGTQKLGKKEGVWFFSLFAVMLAREQPRCQSPGRAQGEFQPI